MSSKNQNAGESPVKTPLKIRINSARKVHMNESVNAKNTSQPSTSKRTKYEDAFLNPWRCEGSAHTPLDIIHHEPKYNPPCYFDKNLNKLAKSEKALRIMSYHYALSIQLSLFQQTQPQRVFLGDPIPSRSLFNGSIDKRKSNVYASEPPLSEENEYISRSGRHIRRRTDWSVDLSDEEDTKISKRAKRDDNDDLPITSTPLAVNGPKKSTNKKQMNNEEIMARSSLFNDSPGCKSRTDAMFSKLAETEKQTKKTEESFSKFEKSLEPTSDDDLAMDITSSSQESPSSIDVNESQEGTFLRRRIVPPVATRKGKSSQTNPELPSTSSTIRQQLDKENVNTPTKNTLNHTNGGPSTSTSSSSTPAKRGPKKKTTNCPICGVQFPIKEIEQHASTCGLTSELEIESSIPNQRPIIQ